MFLVMFIGEIFLTSVSYVVKNLIDMIYLVSIGQGSVERLYFFVALMALMGLIGNSLFRVSGYIGIIIFPHIRRDIRVDFFSYLHAHAHRYFSNHFGGALTNKITTVGQAINDITGTIAWDITPSLVNIFFSLILLAFASPAISAITFIIIIAYLLVFYPSLKKVRKLSAITSEARSASTGKIADVISNIWNLQSNARGRYEEQYLMNTFEYEAAKARTSWRYMENIRT